MTRSKTLPSLREAGFTLLELIVVMAILALTAALALPNGERTRRGLTLQATALDLASSLKNARSAAIQSNREHKLVIDLAGRRFWAEGQGPAHALPRELIVSTEVPLGEQADAGVASVRFRPDGSSSGGKIKFEAPRQTALVSIDWLTGRTRVEWGR